MSNISVAIKPAAFLFLLLFLPHENRILSRDQLSLLAQKHNKVYKIYKDAEDSVSFLFYLSHPNAEAQNH